MLRRALRQARVIAVVRRDRSEGRREPGVEVMCGDLRLARTWQRLPSDTTHVIHLAAAIPWKRQAGERAAVVADNLGPVAQLVQAASNWAGLRHVVYGSSVSVYGITAGRLRETSPAQPATLYGVAKLSGELAVGLLAQRGVAVSALRFSSLYGTGQYPGTVLPLLMDRARRGDALELFNEGRVQDFLHVDDAARATLLACRLGARGPFNVGTGRSVSMRVLARAILRTFDVRRAGRIVVSAPSAAGDPGIRLDIARARRELGYRPRIALADGLQRLAREFAERIS
jgi:UDP-glucose 4-epimerase